MLNGCIDFSNVCDYICYNRMLKIKTITLLLSLLMTLQMLPIAQIGGMLSSNQWTEELPHSPGDDCGKADPVKFPSSLPPEQYHLSSNFSASKALIRIHITATIPSNHSNDVVSPPPDILS